MKPLFVGGCQRSGTTAFAEYMNQHRQILICRKRYRHVPKHITPSFIIFEKILERDERASNGRSEYHAGLLERKDPAELRWIGDKAPKYVRHLEVLHKNNPGRVSS